MSETNDEHVGAIVGRVCAMQRQKPNLILDTEACGSDGYRILPMFGPTAIRNSLKKHYSLGKNEYLQCHWRKYVDELLSGNGRRHVVPEPINCRDFHFFNGSVLMRPSDSLFHKSDFRMTFKGSMQGFVTDTNGMTFLAPSAMASKNVTKKQAPLKPSHLGLKPISGKDEKKANTVKHAKPKASHDVNLKRPMAENILVDKITPKSPPKRKTTLRVTQEATVKVNEDKKKIVVQKKCTVAVRTK